MYWHIAYAVIFLFGYLLCVIFVAMCLKFARRTNVFDRPDNQRKIHTEQIPLLGGIGMYLAFTGTLSAGLLVLFYGEARALLGRDLQAHISGVRSVMPQLIIILGAGLFIVIVGLIDDIRRVSAGKKLFFQFLAAAAVFLSGVRIQLFIDYPPLNALLTVCWIIGITNAFNLMDNMDGLSSGTALISSVIFLIIAAAGGQYFVASLLACFCGVLTGFLRYNFPPAKIFMGDAGSLFIGFTLSVLTVMNTYYTPAKPTPAPVIMPLIILSVPIFDTFSVIYIRLRRKIHIFKADKNHFSHRLTALGMTPRKAVLFIYLVTFCTGLSALLLKTLDQRGCVLVLVQVVCILAVIWLLESVKK